MLNLAWAKTFLALVETKSFQAAADQLQLAQRTVSQQIRKLEEELGVVLVRRSRSGCEPTPAAFAFMPYATSARLFDLVIDRNPVIAQKLDDTELDVAVMEWWDRRPGFLSQQYRSRQGSSEDRSGRVTGAAIRGRRRSPQWQSARHPDPAARFGEGSICNLARYRRQPYFGARIRHAFARR
jgi:DNA-binding transcriptional ArsR family regulator